MIVVGRVVVVDVLIAAAGTDDLRARMAGEELHAPQLIDYEVVSVLRGLTLGGHLTQPRALDAFTDFRGLMVER